MQAGPTEPGCGESGRRATEHALPAQHWGAREPRPRPMPSPQASTPPVRPLLRPFPPVHPLSPVTDGSCPCPFPILPRRGVTVGAVGVLKRFRCHDPLRQRKPPERTLGPAEEGRGGGRARGRGAGAGTWGPSLDTTPPLSTGSKVKAVALVCGLGGLREGHVRPLDGPVRWVGRAPLARVFNSVGNAGLESPGVGVGAGSHRSEVQQASPALGCLWKGV